MPQVKLSSNAFGWLLMLNAIIGSLFGIVGMYVSYPDIPLISLLPVLALGISLSIPAILISVFIFRHSFKAVVVGVIFCTIQLFVYKSESYSFSSTLGISYLISSGVPGLKINITILPILVSGLVTLYGYITHSPSKVEQN